MVKLLYPGGKQRAFTLSFDDGVAQDVRLVKMLNKYGLKSTFNFCGGQCNNPCFAVTENGRSEWDSSDELRECFRNHEIASHTLNHPHLNELDSPSLRYEIAQDVKILGENMGYTVEGFASPYGCYDDRLFSVLRENGIKYHRTTALAEGFAPPKDFLLWHPNAHIAAISSEAGKEKINSFLKSEEELALFMLWGHSYEFNIMDCYSKNDWHGARNRWTLFEKEICVAMQNADDVWFATSIEVCRYILATRRLRVTEKLIENPTDVPIFISLNGKKTVIEPKSVKNIKL